jgi:hypothetical protein
MTNQEEALALVEVINQLGSSMEFLESKGYTEEYEEAVDQTVRIFEYMGQLAV